MNAKGDALTGAQLAATAAALEGDSGRLYRIVGDLLDSGVPLETVLFEFLLPTEKDLGTRWQNGDYMVAEEHAATATIETVVALLAGSFDRPESGPLVVVAAAEGDRHSLPGRTVAAHLLSCGYRVTFLGADVLASDLRDYLLEEGAEALVLSCALTTNLPGARLAIEAAHDAGVPVLVGGRAFGSHGQWATALGADAWTADPGEVAQILEAWTPEPSASEAAVVPPGPGFETLSSARSEVLAAAERAFSERRERPIDRRSSDELQLLYSAVTAAVLVGDPVVSREWQRWQGAMLESQSFDAPEHLSSSLRGALGDYIPMAVPYLSNGDPPSSS